MIKTDRVELIERKLANGATTFTAHEVATLLNTIRILRQLLKKGTI